MSIPPQFHLLNKIYLVSIKVILVIQFLLVSLIFSDSVSTVWDGVTAHFIPIETSPFKVTLRPPLALSLRQLAIDSVVVILTVLSAYQLIWLRPLRWLSILLCQGGILLGIAFLDYPLWVEWSIVYSCILFMVYVLLPFTHRALE